MSKNTESTSATAAEVAGKITDLDAELLEETARHIYIELLRGEMRGRNATMVAEHAYARAKSFVAVTQAIRGGAKIPDAAAMQAPPTVYCKVRLWDGGKGQFGEPLKDDNGQAMYEVQPVDRDAFAPNLPDDHPINQRFYPNALKNNTLCDINGKALSTVN